MFQKIDFTHSITFNSQGISLYYEISKSRHLGSRRCRKDQSY